MIVAGIGCRRGATAEAVLDAVKTAAEGARTALADIGFLASVEDKSDELGILTVAHELGLSLRFYDLESLRAENRRVVTRSPVTLARYGIGSIAEAAALAAVGPHGQLMTARFMNDQAACALAWKEDE